MKIDALAKYRNRESIDDLSEPLRSRAWEWYGYFLMRRKEERKPTPQTTKAILMGQAIRLARTTKEERSTWGRSMLAKRGGLAVQELYRQQGRTGANHPAHKAARISARNRRWRKEKAEAAQKRAALGLPPPTRHKILPWE